MQVSGNSMPHAAISMPKAEGEASARSVQYPRVDEDTLARQIHEGEFDRTPGNFAKVMLAGGGSAAVGGIGGLLLASKMFGSSGAPASMGSKLMTAGFGAVALGALGAWLIGSQLTKMTPGRARDYAAESLDMSARSRPPLPPASAVPTEKVGMPGVVREGISGSTIGGIVRLKQEVVGSVTTSATTIRNDKGEPTIQIGNGSGSTTTTEQVVRTEDAQINSLGLGRVLYDPNGYSTMSEATEAYDGKHAAAIVKEGDNYLLVDVDAENWGAMQDRSFAMNIADSDVKAVFANKGIYYPSSMQAGEGGPRLFLFAQEQDIDQTLPTSLQELRNQPVGFYETNASPKRNEFAEKFQVHVGDFRSGDEFSGPGFSSRAEAVQAMVKMEGNQGLVKAGERYYVSNLYRADGSGDQADISEIVRETPDGAAVIGLRTNDNSGRVELIEDSGGIYAPVEDWWVRVNVDE